MTKDYNPVLKPNGEHYNYNFSEIINKTRDLIAVAEQHEKVFGKKANADINKYKRFLARYIRWEIKKELKEKKQAWNLIAKSIKKEMRRSPRSKTGAFTPGELRKLEKKKIYDQRMRELWGEKDDGGN